MRPVETDYSVTVRELYDRPQRCRAKLKIRGQWVYCDRRTAGELFCFDHGGAAATERAHARPK